MNDRTFYLLADGPVPVARYSHAVTVGWCIFVAAAGNRVAGAVV